MYCTSGLMSGCGLLMWVRTEKRGRESSTYCPTQDELLSEEHSLRSTSPSLLTATVGQRVLSRLDDGSGCTSPENVITLWTEEGIRNSRDILQTLDFPLEERLSLTDLTLALDNELLVSGNGIHQAALISYKNEIQHLQLLAEQACRQRDKVRADLDAADHRNLKLVREVDDRHANMETLNQSRLRDLEQDFRDRLSALRCESEQEIEVLQQQAEEECRALQEELHLLQTQEEELRVELNTTTQENSRLEDELFVVKLKLKEAEKMVNKLQCDLDRVLQDKFEGLDRAGAALSHEERFSEIIKQYELQCRELLDRNDELSSELELLKSQRSDRESRRSAGDTRTTAALTWTEQTVSAESDCDDVDVKQPPAAKKKLQPVDKTGLSSLDNISGPVVSIQTEMALEQLKQKHEQELQELRIQLETQVNFYERNLELMRQNMEVERKDISQAFKLEISELEEHKAQAEQQVQQLKDSLEKLQLQKGGGGIGGGGAGWTSEQERRMQRERSDMEQNFAREIGNLVERLRAEKDQLEAELRLKMDQEVMLVRTQLEELRAENSALQERVKVLQQDVQNLEDDVAKKKRKVEELEGEHERSREEEERLHRENCRYREEVLELSSRNLQLSNDNAELSARLRGDEESLRMLQQRLATVSEKTEEGEALVRRLQTTATQQEREKVQQQVAWTQERHLLEDELKVCKQKLGHLSDLEAELSATTLKLQWMDEDKKKLLRETENHKQELEALQHSIVSLQSEAELFRSRLQAANKDKLGHIQEVTELQRKLEETHNKVERLELSVQRLRQEKEEQCRVMAVQEQQASVTLREETQRLSIQNQELLHQLASLQAKQQEAQNLNHEQQNLKTRLSELETERTKANEQAVRADAALSLVRAQHTRQLQELQERASSGSGNREREEQLETWLKEEQRRSQQLEETLKHQTGLISIKQEQYEKVSSSLQQRTEDLELKLKAVQTVLQENVQQLKEQLAKNAKSNTQLKDVYVENSQLIKALQITEQRQKHAEKKNILLEEKIGALHRLLRQIVPAALAT